MGAICSHPLNLLTCRYLPHFQRGIAYPAFLHTLSKVKLTLQIIQVFLPVTGFAIIASLYLTIGQFVASPIPCLGWLGKTKYLILEEVHFFTICKSFRRRETAFHGVLTIHNYDWQCYFWSLFVITVHTRKPGVSLARDCSKWTNHSTVTQHCCAAIGPLYLSLQRWL